MAQGQLPIQTKASGLGVATAALPALALGRKWIVSQVVVESNSATQTTCTLMRNGITICQSVAGNADTAGGDPPVEYKAGDQVQIQWQNATPNSDCTATFYYDEVRRGS